jgi:hypothetical protein
MMVPAMAQSGGVEALSLDGVPASYGLGLPIRDSPRHGGDLGPLPYRVVAVHDALPAIGVPPDDEKCLIDPPAAVSKGASPHRASFATLSFPGLADEDMARRNAGRSPPC